MKEQKKSKAYRLGLLLGEIFTGVVIGSILYLAFNTLLGSFKALVLSLMN